MKKIWYASIPFLKGIKSDLMMVACLIAPIFMGLAFKLFIPFLESVLTNHFDRQVIISPYYKIFDLLLVIMTPVMACFSGVLTILEEYDTGISKYYFITPVTKKGYLLSRLGLPLVFALIYSIILLAIFNLSYLSFFTLLIYALQGGLIALICSFVVVVFAKNKVEGMSLIKLCGLSIFGLPIAYFVVVPVKYLAFFLPTFWMGQFSLTNNYFWLIIEILISFTFLFYLYRKFSLKLNK